MRGRRAMLRGRAGWLVAACLLIGAFSGAGTGVAGAAITGPVVITEPGVYVLEQNITVAEGTVAIEVLASDVTIDGNGRAIEGRDIPNSCGVLVHAADDRVRNVTVRDLRIFDLQHGCYFWNTEDTSVRDCRIESCTYGVTFNPAIGGRVTDSRLDGNDYGLAISGRSSSSVVRSNRITGSLKAGIYLYRALGGDVTDNYLINARNVYVGNQTSRINFTDGPREGTSIAGGPVLGGNFWGRPSGLGFSQTSADRDRDGICDRTYRVSGYMVDTLPLRDLPNRTPPTAMFTATPPSGVPPLTVRFNDASRGDAGLWDWSFGDGTTAIGRNTTHVYAEPGQYTVTLEVADVTGTNRSVYARAITVESPAEVPTAMFRASARAGAAPLAIEFNDTSSGAPQQWRWTFGDGTSSTERNPRHVYPQAGTYTVGLRVANTAGSSSRLVIRYISVTDGIDEKGY